MQWSELEIDASDTAHDLMFFPSYGSVKSVGTASTEISGLVLQNTHTQFHVPCSIMNPRNAIVRARDRRKWRRSWSEWYSSLSYGSVKSVGTWSSIGISLCFCKTRTLNFTYPVQLYTLEMQWLELEIDASDAMALPMYLRTRLIGMRKWVKVCASRFWNAEMAVDLKSVLAIMQPMRRH